MRLLLFVISAALAHASEDMPPCPNDATIVRKLFKMADRLPEGSAARKRVERFVMEPYRNHCDALEAAMGTRDRDKFEDAVKSCMPRVTTRPADAREYVLAARLSCPHDKR